MKLYILPGLFRYLPSKYYNLHHKGSAKITFIIKQLIWKKNLKACIANNTTTQCTFRLRYCGD